MTERDDGMISPARATQLDRALEALLVVLAFSLPLYRQWVSLAAPLFMIVWLVRGDLRHRVEPLRRHLPALAVALFIGLGLISLLWSSHRLEGLEYLDKYRYLLLIPMAAVTVTEDGRTRILRWFILGAIAATSLSWLALAGLIQTRWAGPDNPAVTMSHLDLSMVLAVAALIALDEVARSASWRHRLVATGAVVWIASGLAINIGRSGQLAFVGAASVWAGTWMARRSRRAAVAAILLVWCTLGLVYAGVPRVRERIGDAVAEIRAAIDHDRYATNQGMRVAGMIVGWDLVRDRPWFGSGVGDTLHDFATVLDQRHPRLAPVLDQFRHQHLHNQYLQITVELGFVGLAALLALLVSLVVHRPRRAADRALLAGLSVAFALGFLGDPFLRKQMPLATFALVAGVLTAVTDRDEEQSPRSQSESVSRPNPASTSRR